MRSMVAPLSPNEENSLRRIGFGDTGEGIAPHVRRLTQLALIEWNGRTWQLTPAGRVRYQRLMHAGDIMRTAVERRASDAF